MSWLAIVVIGLSIWWVFYVFSLWHNCRPFLAMPLLFSYGTLREHDMQRAVFGRCVEGQPDHLIRFDLSDIEVQDERGPHFPNVTYSGRSDSRVNGLVFDISESDLLAADTYIKRAGYRRQPEKLASGRMAWVYVYAG